MKDNLMGLVHVYDKVSNETTVSWAYKDSSEFEYLILEYYDSNKRDWVPYDGHMGIIEKEEM